MKKVKLFSLILGLMLSVATLFANTEANQGYLDSDCPNPTTIPETCLDTNHGNQCVIGFDNVWKSAGCVTAMREP